MLQARDLRARIDVYSRMEQTNDLGEMDYVYAQTGRVCAKIAPVSGRTAALPGGSERAEITHTITIRDKAIPNVTTDMYFVSDGLRYNVQYWMPIYNQRGFKQIMCKVVVEDGAQ